MEDIFKQIGEIFAPQTNTPVRQETERILIDIDATKINHQDEANKLLFQYHDGFCEVDDMLIKIKHIQKVLELAELSIKDAATDYLATHGKTIEKNGIKMAIRGGSNRADFSNVPYVVDLQAKLKAAQEISKQLAKSGLKEIADTDTGEIINACNFTTDKDTLTISFTK